VIRLLLCFAAVAAVATLPPSPASASDFSRLSEPSFARSMLLSPRRSREAQCGALARAEARLNRSMKVADAEAIAGEILRPLTVELGDAKLADELLSGERFGPHDYDDAETAKGRLSDMDMIGRHCAPLFEAFRSGGISALQARLEPSRGLIPLLSLPECVAIAEASSRSGQSSPYDERVVADLKQLARQGGTTEELADREKAIETARARLVANPEQADTLMMRATACLATFRQHAELVAAGRPR
jgi:hypothetical protein